MEAHVKIPRQVFVECIDNTNKPADIQDWPEIGRLYEVDIDNIARNAAMDGTFCLSLKGMNPGNKFDGYRSDRFEIVYELMLN